MADVSVDNVGKFFLINGTPLSVIGGLIDGDAVTWTPNGDRVLAVRGLYGDGVWVDQMNIGHWDIDISCFETSHLNTLLDVSLQTKKTLVLFFEDRGRSIRAGTGRVLTQPAGGISNALKTHTWRISTFNFHGAIQGRLK
jgi:hypothetical protein